MVTETESESIKELMKVGGKHEETVEQHTKEQDGVEGPERKDINNMLRFKQKSLTIYFKDRKVMELYQEMVVLINEMLKEKQRKLELVWKGDPCRGGRGDNGGHAGLGSKGGGE